MKRIIKIFSLVAVMAFSISQLYAIGCATSCAGAPNEAYTGYCVDGDGPEGSRKCTATGTGEKECSRTYTPLICDPE